VTTRSYSTAPAFSSFRQMALNGNGAESFMRVCVSPAKRPGNERTILSEPLEQQEIVSDGDEVCLSFCAAGMYDDKSQYRYTIEFSRSELMALLAAGPDAPQLGSRVAGLQVSAAVPGSAELRR